MRQDRFGDELRLPEAIDFAGATPDGDAVRCPTCQGDGMTRDECGMLDGCGTCGSVGYVKRPHR